MTELTAVLTEITGLLDPPAGARRPSRAAVEYTLTTGYAHALALESERLRLEARLRGLVRAGERPTPGEVAELERMLAASDEKIARLRGLLSTLRAQAL